MTTPDIPLDDPDRAAARDLLDAVTFGNHSIDSATAVVAQALKDARLEGARAVPRESTARERYDLLRTVERVRRAAEELEAEMNRALTEDDAAPLRVAVGAIRDALADDNPQ